MARHEREQPCESGEYTVRLIQNNIQRSLKSSTVCYLLKVSTMAEGLKPAQDVKTSLTPTDLLFHKRSHAIHKVDRMKCLLDISIHNDILQ
jgi:hypothetical protein